MRSHLRGAALAGAISSGCFGDPPGVGDTNEASSNATSSAATDATTSEGPTSEGPTTGATESGTAVTAAASSDPDTGDDASSGSSEWCSAPVAQAFPPHQPMGFPTRFGGLARFGGTLWVAGLHQPMAQLDPAAWTFDGVAFGPTIVQPLGANYEFVSFLDDTYGPPRVIYNEYMVRALLFDDPAMDLVESGQWQYASTPSGFGEVVRTNDGNLWAAGWASNTGIPYWRLATSDTQGMSWTDSPFVYSMAPAQPATANALAIGEDGLFAIAGVAHDVAALRHWVAFTFYDGKPDETPDTVPEGAAFAALVVDGHVLVAGEVSSSGQIRHATDDSAFEHVADFDDPVRDLALGGDDSVVALTGTPQTGFAVWVCESFSAETTCWRKLYGELPPAGGELMADSILVDGDTIWIAASVNETVSGPPAGALFRIEC